MTPQDFWIKWSHLIPFDESIGREFVLDLIKLYRHGAKLGAKTLQEEIIHGAQTEGKEDK